MTVAEPLLSWLLGVIVALTAASYLGRLHKYLELTSHFKMQYFFGSALGLLLCLITAHWLWAAGALLCMGINLSAIVPWFRSRVSNNDAKIGQRLKLALANVDHSNRSCDRFISCMERHQPDVVVVQELTETWARGLRDFGRRYPFSEILPMADGSGIAVYSRWPFDGQPLVQGDDRPGILATLRIENVTVSMLAIHPRAPIRRGHFELRNRMFDSAAACLNGLPSPKICVGDLNTSLWSPFYEDFVEEADLVNVRLGFGLLPSWPTFMGFGWLMIPIDHCLVSRDFRVVKAYTGERIGSDHLPLIVELEI